MPKILIIKRRSVHVVILRRSSKCTVWTCDDKGKKESQILPAFRSFPVSVPLQTTNGTADVCSDVDSLIQPALLPRKDHSTACESSTRVGVAPRRPSTGDAGRAPPERATRGGGVRLLLVRHRGGRGDKGA